MPLHVLHFRHRDRAQWGIVANGAVTPIPGEFATTASFLAANPVERLAMIDGPAIPEADVQWLPPVTANQQFVCQGANYRQHMIESGMDPDAKRFNMIFTKAPSCIVAADSRVVKPRHVRFLDYEIELGLVLKRDITRHQPVTDANLHEYVAGIAIVNDYSARDVQIPQMQFYKGKSYRTFGPVGPYLCLLERSDFPKLKTLELTLSVNGTVRQQDSTANLVYGPAETLTELSGVHDLGAGDLLATGTPAGCALSIPSPAKQRVVALFPESLKWRMFMKVQAQRTQYLKAGDIVEARIASRDGTLDLGVQRNEIVDEAA
ncbi:fumarylacetoacetate hydrolase family protein [Burkholderia latens]|uniref:fumarylacetoacetate hydrolase family protein n=1 Tax=Burkholderia latens TaxID=488446 RepID=UPI00158EEB67|nr:fumarylacetoacetate hydrolase family protein [Burkholderia latens]